jgi:type II secretory pathway predicted ATPase ExeA
MSKKTPPLPPTTLTDLSFGKDVGEDEIFSYPRFDELQAILKLTVQQRSLALITGKAGIGKTTGVRAFASKLPNNRYQVVYFGQDQDGLNFLSRFVQTFGLKPKHHRIYLPMQISQALTDNMQEGGKEIVAVIDEAHLLDSRTLEDIRLLTNSDFDTTAALSVILLGHQQLRIRLKALEFEALNQRLRFRFFLEGFSLEETAAYIKHRLSIAGGAPELFAEDAIQKIFDASEGVPREINNLCALALLKAELAQLDRVDGKLIKQIVSQRELS